MTLLNLIKKPPQGILLINKPAGTTSFSLVAALRKRLNVKKIGHAGTLDPFATGLMVLLVGREYTRLSDKLLNNDKEYIGRIRLGIRTDSYDCDGTFIAESDKIPTRENIEEILTLFQGEILQIPPMFSAKKVKGKKLYELARKGVEIERKPVLVKVSITLLNYEYPFIDIKVACSKGTYIRSLADDIGTQLGCYGHLVALQRTRSGQFHLSDSVDGLNLQDPSIDLCSKLISIVPLIAT